jgi:hypothetical protein
LLGGFGVDVECCVVVDWRGWLGVSMVFLCWEAGLVPYQT